MRRTIPDAPDVALGGALRSDESGGWLCAVLWIGLWMIFPGTVAGQEAAPDLFVPPKQPSRPVTVPRTPVEVPVPLFKENEPDLIQDPVDPVSDPSAELFRSLKQKRFEELKRQLDELSRHWPQPDSVRSEEEPAPDADGDGLPLIPLVTKPAETGATEKTRETGDEWGPVSPERERNGSSEDPPEHDETDPPADPTPTADSNDESEKSEPAEVEPEPLSGTGRLPLPSIEGTTLPPVDGPVDRLSLATSLFGTGEYEVCLQLLELLDGQSLNQEDGRWAAYLGACCHRKLGNIPEAQKRFRQLVADKESGWTGELSRWWLDHLEERARLAADLTRLSETLSAWEKEIEQLRKTSASD
jgi:hypothetical protein